MWQSCSGNIEARGIQRENEPIADPSILGAAGAQEERLIR
jgi:hypothetical protein